MAENPVLDKQYDPRAVEPEVYAAWERTGAFRAVPDGSPHERTFTIMIPLPNVTGALHLGHALNNTLQDVLIRYHRMRGFNTLWQPGTDHAGIATQAVVERRIFETEGKTRHDLGREGLVQRIWQWKDEYEKRIISQLKLMGCSCDWDRTRFTLDEVCARAVRHQFFNLFKDGLIFRGKRLVNWDTELQTAVSNDEVYYESVQGHFWRFKYPVIDPKPGEPEHVIIATTRPETMLGDTAVAVHPDPEGFLNKQEAELKEMWDRLSSRSGKEKGEIKAKLEALQARRESHLAQLIKLRDMAVEGRKLLLPLVERVIPLITDEWAKPDLGSGCVKITPAHDANDYEVGLRHHLSMINVLTPDGKVARIVEADGRVNPHSREYEGLVFAGAGREKVVADLEARGLLHAIEDYDVEIGHSDRSKTPIEPYLSDQWFLQMGDLSGGVELGDGTRSPGLAQAAMDVVTNDRIRIFPQRYTKTYLDWLGEKRDWCIGRQLWWGHRIPVWTHRKPAQTHVSAGPPSGRPTLDDLRTPHFRAPYGSLRIPGTSVTDHARAFANIEEFICFFHDPSDGDRAILAEWFYVEEEDVLDTWFSSALWPFSTLGWPGRPDGAKEADSHEIPNWQKDREYYPGSVLVTSRDIITNWVARMVMFGLYAIGDIPFDHVYVHPKILDGRGETMSKSKGNGVDPVDILHTHGADALRYTMVDMTTETQDIRMPVEYVCPHCGKLVDQAVALKAEEQNRKSRGQKLTRRLQPADCHRVNCTHCRKEFATQWAAKDLKAELGVARETSEKFDQGRNFCNKLWNAARFAFMNLEAAPCERLDIGSLPPEDRWILTQLSQTIRRVHHCLRECQFSATIKEIREFFWDSLCDWYIELTKPRMTAEPWASARADSPDTLREPRVSVSAEDRTLAETHTLEGNAAKQVLAFCLDQTLRLLHPIMPFISERLWEQFGTIARTRGLPGIAELKTEGMLIRAAFPPVEGYPALDDEAVLTTFTELQDATRGVRELRNQAGVSPRDKITATVVVPPEHLAAFEAQSHIVRHMANIGELHVVCDAKRPRNAGSVSIRSLRIYVHDVSDDDAERARTGKSLDTVVKQITGAEVRLGNEKFLAHAKREVVEAERTRLAELRARRENLQVHLAELDG